MTIEDAPPAWLSSCPPGALTTVPLPGPQGEVDLHVVRGARPGLTLAVLAGVHGDEYEGPVAIAEFLSRVEPERLTGTLLALPVANPPAFAAGTRESPLDGLNLARCFPGDPDGSASEHLADALTQQVIRHADAMIDLHSAGVSSVMALLVGYGDVGGNVGARSRELAIAFGAPVVWEHPELSPGRTISTAIDLGIPCVYTEAVGGGGAEPEVVDCYREGIERVLRSLGMLEGDPPAPRHRETWRGEGDTDAAQAAPCAGLFRPLVSVGEDVERGGEIGEILTTDGQRRIPVRADRDGVVVMVRRIPRVDEGERLYLLTARVTTNTEEI